MKCPICDKELVGRMEEQVTCKDKHHFYSYENTAANYEERIGGVIFHSHADSEEDKKLYKLVVKLNREDYQKNVELINIEKSPK